MGMHLYLNIVSIYRKEIVISMEMDSELEESEILQCTPPSIVIQLYVLLLLMLPLNRPISAHFLCFRGKKYRAWHGAHNRLFVHLTTQYTNIIIIILLLLLVGRIIFSSRLPD